MKTYFIPILLTCVFFATISPLQAQQSIYVSPTGNDRNAGTKEAPLASLPAAINRTGHNPFSTKWDLPLRKTPNLLTGYINWQKTTDHDFSTIRLSHYIRK